MELSKPRAHTPDLFRKTLLINPCPTSSQYPPGGGQDAYVLPSNTTGSTILPNRELATYLDPAPALSEHELPLRPSPFVSRSVQRPRGCPFCAKLASTAFFTNRLRRPLPKCLASRNCSKKSVIRSARPWERTKHGATPRTVSPPTSTLISSGCFRGNYLKNNGAHRLI